MFQIIVSCILTHAGVLFTGTGKPLIGKELKRMHSSDLEDKVVIKEYLEAHYEEVHKFF